MKNILLLIVVLALSYFTAGYFGSTYTSFFGAGGTWIGSENSWNFIIGFPLSLLFFITFVSPWLFKSKNSVLWLVVPILLWEGVVDLKHIYLPIILGLMAYGMAVILRKVFKMRV